MFGDTCPKQPQKGEAMRTAILASMLNALPATPIAASCRVSASLPFGPSFAHRGGECILKLSHGLAPP